jgi:hypothetical protein
MDGDINTMNEDQLKGYLAFWDEENYPDWGALPKTFNPISKLDNKVNQDYDLGWHTAFTEVMVGKYIEFCIHPVFGIMKKPKS